MFFGMTKSDPPCRDCDHRHGGCHSTCAGYIAWKDELDREKNSTAAERHGLHAFHAHNREFSERWRRTK